MPERHVFSQDSKIMALNDDDILWQEVLLLFAPVWHGGFFKLYGISRTMDPISPESRLFYRYGFV
jgi:hypothetical protein